MRGGCELSSRGESTLFCFERRRAGPKIPVRVLFYCADHLDEEGA